MPGPGNDDDDTTFSKAYSPCPQNSSPVETALDIISSGPEMMLLSRWTANATSQSIADRIESSIVCGPDGVMPKAFSVDPIFLGERGEYTPKNILSCIIDQTRISSTSPVHHVS